MNDPASAKKKSRERELATIFLARDLGRGKFDLRDGTEPPDFVVALEGRQIGLELRRVVRSARKRVEELRKRIPALAGIEWIRRGLPPVSVSLFYDPHHQLQKSGLSEIVIGVVEAVERNLPYLGGSCDLKRERTTRDRFPVGLRAIHVERFESLGQSSWTHGSSDWIPSLAASDLQREIDKKRSVFERLPMALSEAWLILVVEGADLSTLFDIGDEAIDHVYSTPWKRTALFFADSPRVYDLRAGESPSK